MDRAFYVDGLSESRMTYVDLMRAVAAVEHAPKVLPWEDDASFFANLLAAMRNGDVVLLVDGPGDVERATQVPHPQPPEYKGEGRNKNAPEASVYGSRGDRSEENAPEASAYGSRGDRSEENAPEASAYGSRGDRSEENAPEASVYGSRGDRSDENAPEASVYSTRGDRSEESDEFCLRDNRGRIGLFTSGTTGKPKLVLHSIKSLTRGVRRDDNRADDVWGLAYHPAHMAGLQVFFQALANRNTLVQLFGLPAERAHAAIAKQRISHLSATPTFLNLLCSTGQIHEHVRSVTSGGELSSETLRKRLAKTFPNARLRNIYASTEVGSLLVAAGDAFRVPDRFHDQVRVLDGELLVHRWLLAPSLQENFEGEFYATGDCVEVLQVEPLTFRITSRQGDWINVGGYKVNPHQVEGLVLAMDEVLEATVYGRENSVTGSLVCCDVVLAPGCRLTARDVHTRLSEHVPAYMIPRIVRTVDSIASTSSGKKQRTK